MILTLGCRQTEGGGLAFDIHLDHGSREELAAQPAFQGAMEAFWRDLNERHSGRPATKARHHEIALEVRQFVNGWLPLTASVFTPDPVMESVPTYERLNWEERDAFRVLAEVLFWVCKAAGPASAAEVDLIARLVRLEASFNGGGPVGDLPDPRIAWWEWFDKARAWADPDSAECL